MKHILISFLAFATLLILVVSSSNANSDGVFTTSDNGSLLGVHEHFGSQLGDDTIHSHCLCSADALMDRTVPNGIPGNELNVAGYGFAPDLFHGIKTNPILAPPRLHA